MVNYSLIDYSEPPDIRDNSNDILEYNERIKKVEPFFNKQTKKISKKLWILFNESFLFSCKTFITSTSAFLSARATISILTLSTILSNGTGGFFTKALDP